MVRQETVSVSPFVCGDEKISDLVAEMPKRNPLQAHDAQRIYASGLYSKNREYERVEYNTRTCSIQGVRRIIRKRGSLEEQVVGIVKGSGSAPKPAASTPKKSRTKRVKASKSGSLQAASHVLKDGWLLEPVTDGKLPTYYR